MKPRMLIKGLYTVTRTVQEGDRITASVHLDEHHAVFKGHFPDQPVMPGVCTLQIVQELLEEHLGRSLRLSSASNIKFMALIDPRIHPVSYTHLRAHETVLDLVCRLLLEKKKIH